MGHFCDERKPLPPLLWGLAASGLFLHVVPGLRTTPASPWHLLMGSWGLWEEILHSSKCLWFSDANTTSFRVFLILHRMFQLEGNAPIEQGNKLRLREGERLA